MLNIQPQLPAGASVPTGSDDFGDVFGIYYGLVGDDGFSYEEMRNWAERIKTQVITADGVMKVCSNTMDTVVEVGIPKELKISNRTTSVTITARKIHINS